MNLYRYIVLTSLIFISCFGFVSASTSDGTIDSALRYAWSENMGWIDFGDTDGNVHVTNSNMTGYAWSENAGWISLNCSNASSCGTVDYGISNNNGVLDGFAFGENVGWVDFSPDGGGVIIDSSGIFSGYAWSENAGWINFNLSNSPVTDWRPSSGSSSSGSRPRESTPDSTPAPAPVPVPNTLPSITPELLPETSLSLLPVINTPIVPSVTDTVPNTTNTTNKGTPSISKPSSPPTTEKRPVNRPPSRARIFQAPVSDFTIPTESPVSMLTTILGILSGIFIGLRFVFASPISFSEIVYAPIRIWGLFSLSTGIKKRFVPWGTVYDSVTKQPLDPAIVTVFDEMGKKAADMITDLDGRYGYLLPVGTYTIKAEKTHYQFPSDKLRKKTSDEVYNNLYFGESFTVTEKDPVVKKDIPLDPLEFDWNEFQKKKEHVMQFHSKNEIIKLRIADILFTIGFAFSLFVIFNTVSAYNIGVLVIYIILLCVRVLGRDPRAFGKIVNKFTGSPVPFAILRIFTTDRWAMLSQKVADEYGRYYCLIPKGTYVVTIDKKIEDGSYVKVLDDPKVELHNGIIRTNFKV